jgi:hypothetical protein
MPYLRRSRSAAQLNVGKRRASKGGHEPIRRFMAFALVGFIELRMRQSPMNGTNYAEIVAMRCEHGMTLPEWRQCRGDPWRFSGDRLRKI